MHLQQAAADYGWSSEQATHSLAYIGQPVLRRLHGASARRVLDCGAGNGALSGQLAAAGFDVVGIEPDRKGVLIARQAHPSVAFHEFGVQHDPRQLMRLEAPFDAVVATEVVEHLFAPQQLPAFAAAVLKPGGHLIVTTPYHGYLKNLALSVAGAWDKHHTALWHGGHIKFFSRATLSSLLADSGLRVVGFEGLGRMPWLWKSMLLVARKD
jgi:2-polyprenyl-3-methyl-5-hydroxy-6-metoxy-1,4-benzoquinol methylase